MSSRIGIIGGGLTGLTAAYRLAGNGYSVSVFEEADRPGGLASPVDMEGTSLERFYHHIFTSDRYLLELCRELGIEDRIEWFEPKNAIYIDNRLYPFTSPMDLLLFSPISPASRIRTGILTLMSRFIRDYRPLERQTARDWLVKRAGSDSYEKVWKPLLVSKFDSDADQVSATWIWNKFKLRGSSRGKNISREKLGYIRGGFDKLFARLSEEICKAGGTIRLNCRINGIRRLEDGRLELSGFTGEAFNRVLFTGSPQQLAEMETPLPRDFRQSLSELKSKGNICMVLELERSLSPYYWTTVVQKNLPFVLIIEHTNLVGMDGYNGHIVYLSRYADRHDDIFMKSDEEIESIFLSGLFKVFPEFRREWVKRAVVSRALYAQPVITKNYSRLIPPLKTPADGLYLASMAQVYPEDRGMNYAVRLGIDAADEIMKDM
jgi:Flavin containing amine oxidoreductase.